MDEKIELKDNKTNFLCDKNRISEEQILHEMEQITWTEILD